MKEINLKKRIVTINGNPNFDHVIEFTVGMCVSDNTEVPVYNIIAIDGIPKTESPIKYDLAIYRRIARLYPKETIIELLKDVPDEQA